jgi:hypothetical protein
MRFRFAVACAAATPLLIAAAEPVRLQPSGPWIVDYADDSCRLIRTFGEGKTKTMLALESEAPGEMDMLVIGMPLRSYDEEIPARFLPVQGKPMKGRAAKAAQSGEPGILWSTVRLLPDDVAAGVEKKMADRKSHPRLRPPSRDLAEQAALRSQRQEFASRTAELEIEARRIRPVILETGSLGEPIRMFDKCSKDSLRDWGVDPDLEDKIVRRVWAADPWRWFSANDYPVGMIREGKESEVKVRLLVDASGRVTKCTSLTHFDAPEFNQVVCDRFKKLARFEPAELANGTRVPSYYVNRVVFRMSR